jgi:hypothetical protein
MSGENGELLLGDELLSFYISICALWFAMVLFTGDVFDTWQGLEGFQFDTLSLRTEDGDLVEDGCGGLLFNRVGFLHSLAISCLIF